MSETKPKPNGMSEDLRALLKEYNRVHQMTTGLAKMRAELVQRIKEEGLTKNKFKMNEGKYLTYNKYTRPGELSIRLITSVLTDLGIPTDRVISEIRNRREYDRKHIETIKVSYNEDQMTS